MFVALNFVFTPKGRTFCKHLIFENMVLQLLEIKYFRAFFFVLPIIILKNEWKPGTL